MMISPSAVTPANITEVIQALSTRLREDYVFPNVAEKMCDNLQKYYDEGFFTGITEGESLANLLTGFLRDATNDNHLKVTYKKDLIPSKKVHWERTRIGRMNGIKKPGWIIMVFIKWKDCLEMSGSWIFASSTPRIGVGILLRQR